MHIRTKIEMSPRELGVWLHRMDGTEKPYTKPITAWDKMSSQEKQAFKKYPKLMKQAKSLIVDTEHDMLDIRLSMDADIMCNERIALQVYSRIGEWNGMDNWAHIKGYFTTIFQQVTHLQFPGAFRNTARIILGYITREIELIKYRPFGYKRPPILHKFMDQEHKTFRNMSGHVMVIGQKHDDKDKYGREWL